MQNPWLAAVARSPRTTPSRRTALTALLGGLPGLFLTAATADAGKKRKQQRRRRRRRKDRRPKDPRPNCDVCQRGCAFRSVQAAINAATSGDTIRLCAGRFEESLVIDKGLTLVGVGEGARGTTLYGRDTDAATVRVDGATVTLEQLRITSGGLSPGGIFNDQGTLTLRACTVSGNTNTIPGDGAGGIATAGGRLTLLDSTVADNQADFGGGIVIVDSETILTNSIVRGNTAAGRGGGILISSGTLTLSGSRVEDNTAGGQGGGIFRFDGTVTLNDSVVTGNTPDDCNGNFCG